MRLQALHEIVGGIHFDLKPQQLLVDELGRVKMNDFNTVHLTRPDETGRACVAHGGCPAEIIVWRPPENYAGEVCHEVSPRMGEISSVINKHTSKQRGTGGLQHHS